MFDHFASVGRKINKRIKNEKKDPLSYVKHVNDKLLLGVITETDVSRFVMAMQSKFSSGIDGISNDLLKKLVNSIRMPLCIIINKSLTSGVFPDGMKIAKVRALYKGGNEPSLDNYRPISLLPMMSKMIERHIYLRLMSHMDKNKVIYPKQFGFRKNHSTQDAFALLTGEILSCFSKQFKMLTVFVDLKKAFDTVNHSIILRKLERIGVRDESLNWFKSYLSNRKQKVVYGDTQSDLKNLEMGVPQGVARSRSFPASY